MVEISCRSDIYKTDNVEHQQSASTTKSFSLKTAPENLIYITTLVLVKYNFYCHHLLGVRLGRAKRSLTNPILWSDSREDYASNHKKNSHRSRDATL
jgi:hypothetical protein